MRVSSGQTISRLDSQSRFWRWLHYFVAAILVYHKGPPIWLLHTELYKSVQNISTNIWNYEKRTDFKLGEVSCNITISWLYLPNGSQIIIFLLRNSVSQG